MNIASFIPFLFSFLFGIAAAVLWITKEYWMFSAFCAILFALQAIYMDHATRRQC